VVYKPLFEFTLIYRMNNNESNVSSSTKVLNKSRTTSAQSTPKTITKRSLTRLQRKVTPGSTPVKSPSTPPSSSRNTKPDNINKRSSFLLVTRKKPNNKENIIPSLESAQADSGSLSISIEQDPPSSSSLEETECEESKKESLADLPAFAYTPQIKSVHDEVDNFLAELEANTSSLYK